MVILVVGDGEGYLHGLMLMTGVLWPNKVDSSGFSGRTDGGRMVSCSSGQRRYGLRGRVNRAVVCFKTALV